MTFDYVVVSLVGRHDTVYLFEESRNNGFKVKRIPLC